MAAAVLQVSRHISRCLECFGAAPYRTSEGFVPMNSLVAFEVMRPSADRAANITNIGLVV